MVNEELMLELRRLPDEQIVQLAMIYFSAKELHGIDPILASPKEMKKIRSWIMRFFDVDEYDSPDIRRWFDVSRTDREFMDFFYACHTLYEERSAEECAKFENSVSVFSAETKAAFVELFSGGLEYAAQTDGTVGFVLYDGYAFRKTLILRTNEWVSIIPRDGFFRIADRFQIFHDEQGHRLKCVITEFEEDNETPTVIPFTEAEVKVETFNALRRPMICDPWETLSLIALDVLEKSRLGEDCINAKEKALLPLLSELNLLDTFDPTKQYDFPLLKQYAEKYGKKRLVSTLETLEKQHEPKNLIRIRQHLNRLAYEPLWRELYDRIADSQEEYTGSMIPENRQADFEKMKKTIEDQLHVRGYDGVYPTFRKVGPMRGIHLEKSYDVSYWVGMTRSAEYWIHCTECFSPVNAISIDFACGTAFPKAHETVKDIYSCCFNAGGRRLCKQTYYSESLDENTELQTVVSVAAKRAECKKLTVAEKEADGVISHSWRRFFTLFLIFGTLFSVGFTAAMFLFAVLFTWICDGAQAVAVIMDVAAWLFVFAFSFVGFGVPMAIVTMKADGK